MTAIAVAKRPSHSNPCPAAMIKRFHSALFYASELAKTAEFYKTLGFAVTKPDDALRIELGNFKLVFVDENKTPIKKESGAGPKGLGVSMYVEVENVDAYFESLKAKSIRASSEPRTWPWGKREFIVKDPDGYKLVFYSPVKK